jgi:hypothetical protein
MTFVYKFLMIAAIFFANNVKASSLDPEVLTFSGADLLPLLNDAHPYFYIIDGIKPDLSGELQIKKITRIDDTRTGMPIWKVKIRGDVDETQFYFILVIARRSDAVILHNAWGIHP